MQNRKIIDSPEQLSKFMETAHVLFRRLRLWESSCALFRRLDLISFLVHSKHTNSAKFRKRLASPCEFTTSLRIFQRSMRNVFLYIPSDMRSVRNVFLHIEWSEWSVRNVFLHIERSVRNVFLHIEWSEWSVRNVFLYIPGGKKKKKGNQRCRGALTRSKSKTSSING